MISNPIHRGQISWDPKHHGSYTVAKNDDDNFVSTPAGVAQLKSAVFHNGGTCKSREKAPEGARSHHSMRPVNSTRSDTFQSFENG